MLPDLTYVLLSFDLFIKVLFDPLLFFFLFLLLSFFDFFDFLLLQAAKFFSSFFICFQILEHVHLGLCELNFDLFQFGIVFGILIRKQNGFEYRKT